MNEIVITANEAGQRLDKFLRKYLDKMPLSVIYKIIRTGEVKVNGKKQSQKYLLNNGDVVKLNIEVEGERKVKKLEFLQAIHDFKTAYEDENILVVEKKKGILVHKDKEDETSLTDMVLSYLYEKGEYDPKKETTFSPSPCNRLDMNTVGLVIYAKNYEALKALNEAIRDEEIEKYYLTIVKGRIEDGRYHAYITKDENKNKSKIYDEFVENSKEIITEVKTLESVGIFSELEINLLTGRSHQIRAHLKHLGNPLIGDIKYGDSEVNKFVRDNFGLNSQLLIANKLIFKECSGYLSYMRGKTVTINIPPDYKKIKRAIFKM